MQTRLHNRCLTGHGCSALMEQIMHQQKRRNCFVECSFGESNWCTSKSTFLIIMNVTRCGATKRVICFSGRKYIPKQKAGHKASQNSTETREVFTPEGILNSKSYPRIFAVRPCGNTVPLDMLHIRSGICFSAFPNLFYSFSMWIKSKFSLFVLKKVKIGNIIVCSMMGGTRYGIRKWTHRV